MQLARICFADEIRLGSQLAWDESDQSQCLLRQINTNQYIASDHPILLILIRTVSWRGSMACLASKLRKVGNMLHSLIYICNT